MRPARRMPIATGGCCWPATPRTCTTRWAARDLDLVTADGPLRVFALLHAARPVFLNLGEPDDFEIAPWSDRVQVVDASYAGAWELPALGEVPARTPVLIRPDGHVAWVGDRTDPGLHDALTT
jgi:3-(3-hydroxy-phenyl)propionate hydroxylase